LGGGCELWRLPDAISMGKNELNPRRSQAPLFGVTFREKRVLIFDLGVTS